MRPAALATDVTNSAALRVHQVLLAETDAVDAATLARTTGLHHTTVRHHLANLQRDGLVVVEAEHRGHRGRPRLVYRAVSDRSGAYAYLATVLAEAARDGLSPREVGRRQGRRSAEGSPTADPVDRVVSEARRIGFEPEVQRSPDGVDVVLRRCPFGDVAEVEPSVVCELHLGLAEGLVGHDGNVEVVNLQISDPRAGTCTIVLGTRS